MNNEIAELIKRMEETIRNTPPTQVRISVVELKAALEFAERVGATLVELREKHNELHNQKFVEGIHSPKGPWELMGNETEITDWSTI